jgi:hypothetical protein
MDSEVILLTNGDHFGEHSLLGEVSGHIYISVCVSVCVCVCVYVCFYQLVLVN